MSDLISLPLKDWACLKSIAKDDPEWRLPSVGNFRGACGVEETKLLWNWSSVRSLLDWILVASALGDEWYNYTLLELQH